MRVYCLAVCVRVLLFLICSARFEEALLPGRPGGGVATNTHARVMMQVQIAPADEIYIQFILNLNRF